MRKIDKNQIKELFTYGIGGVLTTAVNYIVYFGLGLINLNYLLANTLAWAAAVIFSYVVNRNVVFGSQNNRLKEFFTFAGLRLVTLAVENLLLYLAIDRLGLSDAISKVAVSAVTVLANYGICKTCIFTKHL